MKLNNYENNKKHDLKHIAIIMDGNARWAEHNNVKRSAGHEQGMKAAEKVIEAVCKIGISNLTLYAFSSENWSRPIAEISTIMGFLKNTVTRDVDNLHRQGIKLKVIGNLSKLDKDLQYAIKKAVSSTANYNNMTLTLAISYGSREEITFACKKIIRNFIQKGASEDQIENINEKVLANYLYDPEMPDVDLLIRPGGCHRISNFLLWQSAYAELLFIDKFWPDFNEDDIINSVKIYSSRQRNFGKRIKNKETSE